MNVLAGIAGSSSGRLSITLLSICKLTHRQSYLNIAAVTMAAPMVALVSVIALGTMFGSF